MSIERRLTRADVTLSRDYPVAVERVWDAFADEQQKLGWWGAGDAMETREWILPSTASSSTSSGATHRAAKRARAACSRL